MAGKKGILGIELLVSVAAFSAFYLLMAYIYATGSNAGYLSSLSANAFLSQQLLQQELVNAYAYALQGAPANASYFAGSGCHKARLNALGSAPPGKYGRFIPISGITYYVWCNQ
jgi:hypothetical protein